MHTLTPPYHFSIVACPPYLPCENAERPGEILYRGSIPAVRNFPFLKRLHLRTIIVLQKKPLGDGEALVRWAARHKVEIKWIKAEKMTEESLGMGRAQVGDALKVSTFLSPADPQTMLDPSSYPLYIADKDGISHTTLLISCLRKLQGWTPESILDEITRFEPDHEDLPLVPFITSYLATGPSTDALVLPTPPLPSWLWPTTMQSSTGISEKSVSSLSSSSSPGIPHSRSNTALSPQTRERESPVTKDREKDKESKEKEKERERHASAPAATGPLPFPNPLSSRKHPTMKLTFPTPSPSTSMPPPPTPTLPLSSKYNNALSFSDVSSSSPTTSAPALSRVNSRRERSSTATTTREEDQSLMAAATSILAATLVTLGIGEGDEKDAAGVKATPMSEGGKNTQVPGRRPSYSGREEVGQVSHTVSRDITPASGLARARQSTLGSESSASAVGARGGEEEILLDQGGEGRTVVDLTTSGNLDDGIPPDGGASGESSGTQSDEVEEPDETEDDEDEDEDEDEDDDDDDDDDADLQPTSLHISALDLAGYS